MSFAAKNTAKVSQAITKRIEDRDPILDELGLANFLATGKKDWLLKATVYNSAGKYNSGWSSSKGYRPIKLYYDRESKAIVCRIEILSSFNVVRVERSESSEFREALYRDDTGYLKVSSTSQVYTENVVTKSGSYSYQYFPVLVQDAEGDWDLTVQALKLLDNAYIANLINSPRVAFSKLGYVVQNSITELANLLPEQHVNRPWQMGSKRSSKRSEVWGLDATTQQHRKELREGKGTHNNRPRVQYR